MTQQEFFERTKVEVSNDEFFAIHEVYNYSDLDKDEFCKLWCKMNQTRVKAAKAEIKSKQQDNRYRAILVKWFDGWRARKDFADNYYTLLVYTKLPNDFVRACAHFDIRFGNAENVSDVYYKIGTTLGLFRY